jgi:hypothetical protein
MPFLRLFSIAHFEESYEMTAATHELAFDGGLLRRGFWLYVWEITCDGRVLYYVGRTGDSSSLNAQSPFNRMAQHLGFRKESNALRKQLDDRGIAPEQCRFRLVAHGPVLDEGKTREEHRPRMQKTAAMEKALAQAMCAAGYDVLNSVKCRVPLDQVAFAAVRKAFEESFPKLKKAAGANA